MGHSCNSRYDGSSVNSDDANLTGTGSTVARMGRNIPSTSQLEDRNYPKSHDLKHILLLALREEALAQSTFI